MSTRVEQIIGDVKRPEGSALILHLMDGDEALFRQQRRCLVALEGAGAVAPSPLTLLTTPRPWPSEVPLIVPMLVDASEKATLRWLGVLEELGWGLVLLSKNTNSARLRWGGSGALVGLSDGTGSAPWCLDEAQCDSSVRVSLSTGWAPPVGVCSVVSLTMAATPARVTPLVSQDDSVAARGMAVLQAGSLANRAMTLANRVAGRLPGR
ncbi:MAG: hypothetical protein ACI81R_001102 [Bradymonadia bacterium]|jgi:hypothetical protein